MLLSALQDLPVPPAKARTRLGDPARLEAVMVEYGIRLQRRPEPDCIRWDGTLLWRDSVQRFQGHLDAGGPEAPVVWSFAADMAEARITLRITPREGATCRVEAEAQITPVTLAGRLLLPTAHLVRRRFEVRLAHLVHDLVLD